MRPWLLPPVWERMAAGRGEFLAELRPAFPVFVRFGGLDFDADPNAPDRPRHVRAPAQRVFDELGGYVLQLTIGDKGAYLYAVFGSPVAHEDDAARACAAALELREPTTSRGSPTSASASRRVGCGAGRTATGERRTFCCLGDAVNLSARLMARAPAGESGCTARSPRRRPGSSTGTRSTPISLKGKAQPVLVRALRGRSAGGRVRRTEPSASARWSAATRSWRCCAALVAHAVAGHGQVVVVRAEAGVGKSRLVGELVDDLATDGVTVASRARRRRSPAQRLPRLARASGLVLLGLDLGHAGLADVERRGRGARRRAWSPARRCSGPCSVSPLPDNDLTAAFDGELRKTSLEDLLARLLAAARRARPLVLVLEDGHWLDALSRDLLGVLARVTVPPAVLLVFTSRPDGIRTPGCLSPPRDVHRPGPRGARARGGAPPRGGPSPGRHRREPSAESLDLVVSRAEGNPFYLEQLVDYVAAGRGPDADEPAPTPRAASSLHSLVLSRIDAQAEGPRRAVKVASVVGRSFRSGLLAGAYPELGDDDEVTGSAYGRAHPAD